VADLFRGDTPDEIIVENPNNVRLLQAHLENSRYRSRRSLHDFQSGHWPSAAIKFGAEAAMGVPAVRIRCGFLTFMWWRRLLAGPALKTGLVNPSFAAADPIERLAMNDVQLFWAVARCGLASTKDEQSWAMATSMLAIKALLSNPA